MDLRKVTLLAAGVRLVSAELCSPFSSGTLHYCDADQHCCKEGCCPNNVFTASWFLYPGLLLLMILWFCIRIWIMSRQARNERENLARRVRVDLLPSPSAVYGPLGFSATAGSAVSSVAAATSSSLVGGGGGGPYRSLSSSPPAYHTVMAQSPPQYHTVATPPPPYSSVVGTQANLPKVHESTRRESSHKVPDV